MIGLYRRLLTRVRSVNRLNRVHISLENNLTPRLVADLDPKRTPTPAKVLLLLQGPAGGGTALTLGEDLFNQSEAWRTRSVNHVALAGKAEPESFERRRLLRDIFLYTAGAPRSSKELLIVFGGGALRPMMPISPFLQHLNANSTDVLFLRDPSRKGFRSGLMDAGASLEEVVAKIPLLVDLPAYSGMSTLGTSAGGIPALIAGLALGARTVIAMGPNHPDDERRKQAGRPLDETLSDLRQGPGRATQIFVLWGELALDDRPAADAIAQKLGASVIKVSDPDREVRHGTMYPLAQQRRLAPILDALIHGERADFAYLKRVPTLDVETIEAR